MTNIMKKAEKVLAEQSHKIKALGLDPSKAEDWDKAVRIYQEAERLRRKQCGLCTCKE